MAQYLDDIWMRDPEARDSIRVTQQRRSMKHIAVIGGLIVTLFVGFIALYLAYSDQYGSVHGLTPSEQTP